MSSSPILKDKNAIVFGAGGSIGVAVAKEFAAEGAEIFLAGRTKSNVEEVAKEIIADGGRAHAAVIDAMDDVAVSQYIDDIAKRSGSIDIVFNAVGVPAKQYGNGKSAVDLTIEEFMLPVITVLKSQFITARAAAIWSSSIQE
jgi:NAD(P)-dependent dehydrogenase (short-subunit alcohol dehydrogenase family)